MTAKESPKKSSKVDVALANRALQALLKHHQAESEKHKSLLGDDTAIQVQFTLQKVPENPSPKPIRVSIPHSLHKVDDNNEGVEEPSVCLIVKEESKKWVQEMISNFPKEMGFVKKVLGLQSLRKKHGRFEQRRQLLARFDVFMADDRILPMLAKSLGKDFFKAKKQPIPIAITRKQALPFTIMQSLQATFLFIAAGTTLTVRAGTTGMPPKFVLENIQAVVENAVPKIPRKWSNIRSISIKTPTSMSLPFYNKTRDELEQISKMAGLVEEEEPQLKEEDVKAEKEAKRKLAAKSPLVQALKKMDKDVPAESNTTKKKADNTTKKKADKEAESESAKSKDTTNESAKKKKRKISAEVDDRREEDVKAEKETKRKLAAKSPLVQALKKMDKDLPAESKVESAKSKEATNESTEKKKKRKISTEVDDAEPKVSKNEAKKSSEKKMENDVPVESKETKRKAGKKAEPESGKSKDVATESAKKKKRTMSTEVNDGEPKESKNETTKSKAQDEFIASKKYKGSKEGYVFRSGKQGVGYYVDVKPVVDRMAMEAFKRVGASKSRGGGRKSSKSSGKRGRR